jgi:hypothetical protein
MPPSSHSNLVLVFLSPTAATAQMLSISPAEYFGGSNNHAYLDWRLKIHTVYLFAFPRRSKPRSCGSLEH